MEIMIINYLSIFFFVVGILGFSLAILEVIKTYIEKKQTQENLTALETEILENNFILLHSRITPFGIKATRKTILKTAKKLSLEHIFKHKEQEVLLIKYCEETYGESCPISHKDNQIKHWHPDKGLHKKIQSKFDKKQKMAA